jgi:hypothetical protein
MLGAPEAYTNSTSETLRSPMCILDNLAARQQKLNWRKAIYTAHPFGNL